MIDLDADFLRGSYPPLITPFRPDGSVDYDAYAALVEVQIREGTYGILVNGTTSEPSTLTTGERNRLVDVAVDAAAGRRPVVAATGSQSHAETVALTEHAQKAGVDALTRYMAGIGGDHGIRVNCVRPGQILTPGATRGTSGDRDGGHHVFEKMFDFAQIVPGPGRPRDVANLVLFLCCDDSRFISGEIINIDGGVAAKI